MSNKCPICEEELVLDQIRFDMTSYKQYYCANKHCDVGEPTEYKVGRRGWFRLKPPHALTSAGWANWYRIAKEQYPFKFWLSNTVRVKLSVSKMRYWDDPINWVRYRTYNRYHRISTGMRPGWSDVTEQMLYVNFTMLVNFIEIEKAHDMLWSDDVVNTQKWWQRGPLDNWRDPKLGLDHLKWEMEIKDDDGSLPPQAHSAKEMFELYNWWKARPEREDPMDVSGLTALLSVGLRADDDFIGFIGNTNEIKGYEEASQLCRKLEAQALKEDDDNLARLIKIRHSLWS